MRSPVALGTLTRVQSIWMVVAALLFSLMGVGVKLASTTYNTWEIVAYRGLVGVVVMSILTAVNARRANLPLRDALRTRHLAMHLQRGISGTMSLTLWFFAIAGLPLATAMTINSASPLVIGAWVAFGALRLGQGIDRWMTLALVTGFAGVVLLLRPSFNEAQWTYGLMGLGSTVLTAVAYLSVKALGGVGEPTTRIVLYFSAMNAAAGLIGASFFGFHAIDARGAAMLAGVGLCGALAQLAVTRAFSSGGTLLTANLGYTGIVFSTVWGMLVFGDVIHLGNGLGMAIVVVSSVLATAMTARTLRREARLVDETGLSPDLPERSMQPLVTAAELAEHIDEPRWIVFDCRHDLMTPAAGEAAYREGHLAGARFASLDRDLSGSKDARAGRHPLPDRDAFARFLAANGVREDTVVIGYDASNGLYAARLWWLCRWIGHPAVAVLDGGLAAWQRLGRSLTGDVPNIRPGDVTAGAALVQHVDTATMEDIVADRTRLVVDARAPERYRGDVEPLDPVAGHIPHAVNHPMARNLAADGRLKDAATLREGFAATFAGRAAGDVIQSCGSGVTACHSLLAMEVAGLRGGVLYAGSWSAWCADPARPLARGD